MRTVIVTLAEGGVEKFDNVVEYDHVDGNITITLDDGRTVHFEHHEFTQSAIRENRPVNEQAEPLNS